MRIITISRDFASGGSAVGKMLAEPFGFPYYDSEILNKIVRPSDFYAGFIHEASHR